MDWLITDAVNAAGVAPVDPSWFGGGALVLAFAGLLGVFAVVVVCVVAADRGDWGPSVTWRACGV